MKLELDKSLEELQELQKEIETAFDINKCKIRLVDYCIASQQVVFKIEYDYLSILTIKTCETIFYYAPEFEKIPKKKWNKTIYKDLIFKIFNNRDCTLQRSCGGCIRTLIDKHKI